MGRLLAAAALLALVFPVRADAEWHFSPSIGVTFAKGTNLLDLPRATERRHRGFGATVSWLGDGILGAEAIVFLTPSFFEGSPVAERDLDGANRTLSLSGNLVLTTPRLWTEYSLRPFVSGGVGLLHARQSDDPVFPLREDFSAFNVGAGAIGFLSDRTGVRFEMRYHGTLRRHELAPALTRDGRPVYLRYMTASIGFVIRAR